MGRQLLAADLGGVEGLGDAVEVAAVGLDLAGQLLGLDLQGGFRAAGAAGPGSLLAAGPAAVASPTVSAALRALATSPREYALTANSL